MININFSARQGGGIRSRAASLLRVAAKERPIVIVMPSADAIECNWVGDVAPGLDASYVTVTPFLYMMQQRTIDPKTIVVIDQLPTPAWNRILPWLEALPNEVWTINKPESNSIHLES